MDLAEQTISLNNITQLCRICLSSKNTTLMSELIIEQTTAANLFQECIEPTIKTETCKESICQKCFQDLLDLHRFKTQITLNDRIFNTLETSLETNQSQTAIIEETTLNYTRTNCKNCKCKNLTLNDLPNICRLCFKTENIHPIKSLTIENQSAIELLKKLCKETSFESDQLCEACLNKLYDNYLFQTQFTKHNELVKQLQMVKLEPIVHLNGMDEPALVDKERKVNTEQDENIMYECLKCRKLFTLPSEHKVKGHLKFTKKTKCQTCAKYVTATCFKIHERTHTSEKPFSCELNNIDEPSVVENKGEVNTEQDEDVMYECLKCLELFTLPSEHKVEGHLKFTKKTKCQICDKFVTSTSIKIHERTHSSEKPFSCDLNTIDEPPVIEKKQVNNETKYDVIFECFKCREIFTSRTEHNVEGHTKFTRKKKCKICAKYITASCIKMHERTHTGAKPFSCAQCPRRFTLNVNLRRHMRKHSGERPFVCDRCGAAFERADSLKGHARRAHADRPRKAREAGARRARNVLGPRPFVCETCGKAFKHAPALHSHQLEHGARKYACTECEMRFFKKPLLESHMRTHTGERPHACGTCARRFSHAGSLAAHERVHSGAMPYECEVCGRRFKQGAHLRTHRRTHTGVKPYACEFCGKAFALNCSKKEHERIHIGEKQFSCAVCMKAFLHLSTKNKHERLVHAIMK